MAESSLDQEDLSCPACLGLLKDPVTTPCGHNYSKNCDQHRGHCTVFSATERDKKQAKLSHRRTFLLQRIQDKETDLEKLQEGAQDISFSAQLAVQHCRQSFSEIAKRFSEVEEQIQSEAQTQLKRVQELQDQLQQDIAELKKSISDLDALSLTPDHNQFLQHYPSLCTNTKSIDRVRIQTGPYHFFEDVITTVAALRDELKLTLETGMKHVSKVLNEADVFRTLAESIKREDFLQYSTELTLDPNTAHKSLSLSDKSRKATVKKTHQRYHAYLDSSSQFPCQVLSKESLTGRCYWEVSCTGRYVGVVISYKDLQSKEASNQCDFGSNNNSWVLNCGRKTYSFSFDSVKTKVPGPFSPIVGVYLDHSAGTLSFYSVRGQYMTLLLSVQTAFTQPVYAGLWFHWYNGNSAKLI